MNWYQVRTKWPSVMSAARTRWDRLTPEELESISGDRERLVAKLQEQYGYLRSAAEREADGWARRIING